MEVPFGGLTHVGSSNHVVDGVQIPKGKEQFWGLSGPLKSIGSHCCSVHSKNNGISVTAAANCIAPSGQCRVNFPP